MKRRAHKWAWWLSLVVTLAMALMLGLSSCGDDGDGVTLVPFDEDDSKFSGIGGLPRGGGGSGGGEVVIGADGGVSQPQDDADAQDDEDESPDDAGSPEPTDADEVDADEQDADEVDADEVDADEVDAEEQDADEVDAGDVEDN